MTDSVRNLMLVIAYDGRNYHGWQRQADGIETVQLRVEDALRHVLRHPLTIQGCSRTDAGVHAQGQVVSVKTGNSAIPAEGLRRALNSRLPADIVVRSVRDVPLSFNASGNACGKTYRYRIYTAPTRPVELAGQVYCYGRRLDAEKMRQAAARLTGRHDFAAFASAAKNAKIPFVQSFHAQSATSATKWKYGYAATVFYIIWFAISPARWWRSAEATGRSAGLMIYLPAVTVC